MAFDTNAPGAPLQRIFGSVTGINGFLEVELNDTIGTAQSLEPFQFLLNFDPAITDEAGNNTSTTIPHLTIQGGGNGSNDFDVYSFEVTTPNSRVIFDIDNSTGFDTWPISKRAQCGAMPRPSSASASERASEHTVTWWFRDRWRIMLKGRILPPRLGGNGKRWQTYRIFMRGSS